MSNLDPVVDTIQNRLQYDCLSDISERTRIAPSTLYYWREHQLQRPSASVLERLARYYGITLTSIHPRR